MSVPSSGIGARAKPSNGGIVQHRLDARSDPTSSLGNGRPDGTQGGENIVGRDLIYWHIAEVWEHMSLKGRRPLFRMLFVSPLRTLVSNAVFGTRAEGGHSRLRIGFCVSLGTSLMDRINALR